MPSKRILAVGYEELLWSAQALLSERNTGHQQKFMLDAVIAVITKGEKFLLIQRAPGIRGGGRWAPVSGEVEPGESQEAAVAREAMEEVGLTVRPVRKVWECVSTGGSFLLHWWIAEYVSGELALNPAEASAARWLTVEEICRLDGTFEGDRDFYLKILPSLSS
ncbi:MAG TPA: NUDIX domain-containing protein [Candidatus Eisenbacteria bacterium]|nr:NUDIX domain-containing protein [Candidatus Eisenbacteria bacterium]